eukprot:SAG22_NODE_1094_length_5587_cov_6.950580_1_plen_128_part_00
MAAARQLQLQRRPLATAGAGVPGSSPLPAIKFFTAPQCSLCDVAKDVLSAVAESHPHTLELIDITAPEHKPKFHARYKWDIPVIWVGQQYFAKHRLDAGEVEAALEAAAAGRPVVPIGEEPDSSKHS